MYPQFNTATSLTWFRIAAIPLVVLVFGGSVMFDAVGIFLPLIQMSERELGGDCKNFELAAG